MSLSEATSHSIAQLRLLAQAAVRLKATDGLLHCETTLAATAACMTKDGNRILRKVRKSLTRQAHGDDLQHG